MRMLDAVMFLRVAARRGGVVLTRWMGDGRELRGVGGRCGWRLRGVGMTIEDVERTVPGAQHTPGTFFQCQKRIVRILQVALFVNSNV